MNEGFLHLQNKYVILDYATILYMNTLNLSEKSNYIEFYRWIWSEKLENNTFLPVGWSTMSSKLTKKLFLDFDAFEVFPTQNALNHAYESVQEKFLSWFLQTPEMLQENIDPKHYYELSLLQNSIMRRLWERSEEKQKNRFSRYRKNSSPNLSDFCDGSWACAEIAVLWQYALQEIGIASAYMGGVWIQIGEENKFFWEDHSFIILFPWKPEQMIWDIARPQVNNLPSLYKLDTPVSSETFIGKDNYLIESTDILSWSRTNAFWISHHLQTVNDEFRPNIVSSKISTSINTIL